MPQAQTKPVDNTFIEKPVAFQPTNDRVMIKASLSADKVGSLFIPESARKRSQLATVVAVGTGPRLYSGEIGKMPFKPGQTVMIGEWTGVDVEIDGEKYLIVKEADILGIVG